MKKLCFGISIMFAMLCLDLNAQYAANFDGKDDYALAKHHLDFNFGVKPFTIEAQVSNLDTKTNHYIYSKYDGARGLEFGVTNKGELFANINGVIYSPEEPIRIDMTECNHIALVRNEEYDLYFYINGQAYWGGSESNSVNNKRDVLIGKNYNSKEFLSGLLDELRVWSVARTDTQIYDNKDACLELAQEHLVAYWNIESPGHIFNDVTLNGHNARMGDTYQNDGADPVFESEACYEKCCITEADFLIDNLNPFIAQYVNFTNASQNANSYQWIVDGNVEAATTGFQWAFSAGTHIVQLMAVYEEGCRSLKSWVIEVDEYAPICGPPLVTNQCVEDESSPPNPMKIYDSWGNCHTVEEFQDPNAGGAANFAFNLSNGICTAGIFRVRFMDVITGNDYGFDDPTDGVARQEVICRVFEDLSHLVCNNYNLNPSNPSLQGFVRIDIAISGGAPNSTITMSTGTIATGGQFFFHLNDPSTAAYLRGETAKTIITEEDSYLAYAAIDPDILNVPHGQLRFNIGQFSFNSDMGIVNTTNLNQMQTTNHMYLVALHEALHALGFLSMIVETSPMGFVSGYQTNKYSYYDQFLVNNNGSNLITNNFNGGCLTTVLQQTMASCGNMFFDGNFGNNSNHPIYYQTGTGTNGSDFSHFNCTASTASYVMNFSGIAGIWPNDAETQTLADLGYNLSDRFGQNLSSQNLGNSLHSYATAYNSSICQVIGVSDVYEGNSGFAVERFNINALNFNQTPVIGNILANDQPNTSITSYECLKIHQGGGLIIPQGPTSFIYEPDLTFGMNYAILSYVPVCSSGERGEPTYVYIWVPAQPQPACNVDAQDCNLICNGDFEAFLSRVGIFGGHPQLQNFQDIKYGNLSVNNASTDLFEYSANQTVTNNNNVLFCNTGAPFPLPHDFPNKSKYAGTANIFNQAEAIQLQFKNGAALSSTRTYELGFWVNACYSDFDLRFVFSQEEPCVLGWPIFDPSNDCQDASAYVPSWGMPSSNLNDCITYGVTTTKENLAVNVTLTPAELNTWAYRSITFTPTVSGLDELLIHIDRLNNNAIYVMLDDISIEDITVPQIHISAQLEGSICPDSDATIVYTIEGGASIDPLNPLTGVLFDVTVPNLPISPTMQSNTDFAVNGNIATTNTTLTVGPGDIFTLRLPISIAANAIIGSANPFTINSLSAGNGCISASSTDVTNIIIQDPIANQLSLNATLVSNISGNLEYEIEVINTGTNDIVDILLEVPAVMGLNFTFNPVFFDLQAGASQSFTLNATDVAASPTCAELCAEINSASFACNLPLSSCATAINLGGAVVGNSITFPIEVEDPTNANPTLFTATAIGTNDEVYGTGIFNTDINIIEGGNSNSLTKSVVAGCGTTFRPFIMKYGGCGYEWGIEIPACVPIDLKAGPDIEVGNNGDIYVAFSYTGSFSLVDQNSVTQTFTSQGGADITILKYDNNGNFIWGKSEGGLGNDYVSDIETYFNGTNEEVFIVGTLYGSNTNTVSFGISPNNVTLSYNGTSSICPISNQVNVGVTYVASYSDNGPGGALTWANSVNGTTISGKLAVNSVGEVFIAGLTNAIINELGGIGTASTTENNGVPSAASCDIDVFVLKYNNLGNLVWGDLYGSNNENNLFGTGEGMPFEFDIVCEGTSSLGLLLQSGLFVNPGAGSASYMTNAGTFLLKLDASNGAMLWTRSIANPTSSINNAYNGNLTYLGNLLYDGIDYVVSGSYFLHDPNSTSCMQSPHTCFSDIDFYGGTTVNYSQMLGHPALSNDGYQAWYIKKISPSNGNTTWTLSNQSIIPLGGVSQGDDFNRLMVTDLSMAQSGDIYCSFMLSKSTVNIGGSTLTGGVAGNSDGVDGFITKINGTTGAYLRPTDNTNNSNAYTNNESSNKLATKLPSYQPLGINLFPNPTHGSFQLQIQPKAENLELERIQILDITGRLVKEVEISNTAQEQHEINLGNQAAGTYMVKIMANGQQEVKRIVLMR